MTDRPCCYTRNNKVIQEYYTITKNSGYTFDKIGKYSDEENELINKLIETKKPIPAGSVISNDDKRHLCIRFEKNGLDWNINYICVRYEDCEHYRNTEIML